MVLPFPLLPCVVLLIAHSSVDIFADRPVLKQYMERVKETLSPHYENSHAMVREWAQKHGGVIPGHWEKRGDEK